MRVFAFSWIDPARRLLCLLVCGLLGIALVARPARAELYKCQQANGQISYQQYACEDRAGGDTLTIDTRLPTRTDAQDEDYSVESQAQAMQSERELLAEERERARQEASEARRTSALARTERDPAKCAQQRAEVAKWKQKAMSSYRTRSERDLNENKLAYHQTLADRYCD